MKHPNAAYDLGDNETYARAAVEGLSLSPKHAEAIRLQHKLQLTDHVVIVQVFGEKGKNGKTPVVYKCKDRRTNEPLITLESRTAAENYAETCNRWSDDEYISWFNSTAEARKNEQQLGAKNG